MDVGNLFTVAGKNVLVTGGGRGIGEMIAEGLVQNGANVLICSRDKQACETTANRLNGLGSGKCIALSADLGTLEGVEGLVKQLKAVFDGKLHALVNNSGKAWGQPIDAFDTKKGFEDILRLNVTAPFHLTKLCLPLLEAAQTPGNPAAVINIASIDGMRTPMAPTYSYSTSKTGLIALSRHLARDLAPRNITVNVIAPGPFFTRMLASNYKEAFNNWTNPDHPAVQQFKQAVSKSNPSGRLGEAADIAGTAIFLMSKAGAYVNGATVNLDGGQW
eukprot:CAMPEP_0178381714 /NCGR_PEP_ID=MMETSP0689_2-20121128/6129_1 /TAXON_ID=160604 /ORGANISM="Amphidinium massartii, Strain CS-259" /LENGTH=274 /DNA_ID=CAMNT_0020001913 /DNA_START=12 /DNA_END=833 /DNA_ORIENTATION=+